MRVLTASTGRWRPVFEGDEDGVEVVGDGVAETDESVDAGAPGPLQPLLEQLERFLKGKLEDKAEVLLQEVSTEERLVDSLEPAELAALFVCQVLGVLPDADPGSLR